jgi:hypothetical protein
MGKDTRSTNPSSKVPRKPSDEEGESDERKTCSFVFCEDPTSGQIIAVPGGDCPEGFVKTVVNKAQEDGIVFRVPQFKLEDFGLDEEELKEFFEWKRKHKKKQRQKEEEEE